MMKNKHFSPIMIKCYRTSCICSCIWRTSIKRCGCYSIIITAIDAMILVCVFRQNLDLQPHQRVTEHFTKLKVRAYDLVDSTQVQQLLSHRYSRYSRLSIYSRLSRQSRGSLRSVTTWSPPSRSTSRSVGLRQKIELVDSKIAKQRELLSEVSERISKLTAEREAAAIRFHGRALAKCKR